MLAQNLKEQAAQTKIGNKSVTEYIAEHTKIRNKMAKAGIPEAYDQKETVRQVINGLTDNPV